MPENRFRGFIIVRTCLLPPYFLLIIILRHASALCQAADRRRVLVWPYGYC